MSKEKLVAEAKKKFEREQLIAEAKAKFAAEQPAPETPIGDKVAGAVRSGVEGLTFGISEPVWSGAMAGQMHLIDAAQKAEGVGDFAERVTDIDALKAQYDADVQRRRQFKADNPGLQMGAEMTGAIAPAFFTGGTTAIAKGVTKLPAIVDSAGALIGQGIKQIPKAEALLASKGVTGSVARVAEGAAKAAGQGVAAETISQQVEGATGFLKPEEMRSMGDVATDAALFGGALKLPGEVAEQGTKLLRGAAKTFAGVKGDVIDAYMANPQAIREAKTVAEIKDELDLTMQKLRDDVDNAVITKDQAKDAMKQAEQKVDDLVRENKNLIASQKADIRAQFKEAKSDLNIAFKGKQSEIKGARYPVQADDVLDSVEDVKRQVSDLSSESYRILGAEKGKVNIGSLPKAMERIKSGMAIEGELISQDAKNAFDKVSAYQEKFTNIAKKSNGEVSFPQVKQLIQEIDKDIRKAGDKMAGEFNTDTYDALMGVRSELDSILKERVAGYREVMQETARMNTLRRDLVKAFGSREGATSKLSRIDSPSMANERDLLTTLGQTTGKDFKTPLDEFMSTRAQGRTPVALEGVKQSLPEYQPYVDAMAAQARASRPEYGRGLIERVQTASPEAAAMRNAQGAYEAAQAKLGGAKEALDPFKRITPVNSENFIRTLMGDKTRKLELKKLLVGLDQVSDQQFMQMIEDLRVREAFEKGSAQGSSNVNLWAILGGAGGFALGDPTLGVATAGAGATIGKVMDSYGPKITRRVLDGILYMKGIPTVQKIEQTFADLPQPVRDQLKNDLVRAVTMGNSSQLVNVPPDQRIEIADDIKKSDGLNSIQKATAISEMNKKGVINSGLMQQIMVGDEQAPDPAQAPIVQPRVAPSIESVTDFVKQRKPEAY